MTRSHPYLSAFRKAAEVFRRAGIRPALAAARREVSRQKAANAIRSAGVFMVGDVAVRHFDARRGVLIAALKPFNPVDKAGNKNPSTSIRVSADGYSVNGAPIASDSVHFPKLARVGDAVNLPRPPAEPEQALAKAYAL